MCLGKNWPGSSFSSNSWGISSVRFLARVFTFGVSFIPFLQILDYTIQMHRLLPLVATAYGFHFAGQALTERLRMLEKEHIHGEYYVYRALMGLMLGHPYPQCTERVR